MERSHALGWLLAAALPWVMPTAFAARPAACSTLQRPAQALPDPVACTRAVLRSSAGTQGDTATQVGSLFEIASAAADAGRPQRASEALDCADAVIAAAHPMGDWPLRYQAVRRRSLLAYREERIDIALDGFECALHMATQQGDRTAIAKDLKNVGSALRRLGDFRYDPPTTNVLTTMAGVFSSTRTLLSSSVLNRVPDAIAAGNPYYTYATLEGGVLPTNIPKDFGIADTLICVPENAAYLFVSPNDFFFGDNLDPEGDYQLEITRYLYEPASP